MFKTISKKQITISFKSKTLEISLFHFLKTVKNASKNLAVIFTSTFKEIMNKTQILIETLIFNFLIEKLIIHAQLWFENRTLLLQFQSK